MKNIEEMRVRHGREIEYLQSLCQHSNHKRMPYMWAPGHLGNDVEVCEDCGKILNHYNDGESILDLGETLQVVSTSPE